MRTSYLLLILGISVGCAHYDKDNALVGPTPEEYAKVWNTTHTVLVRNGFLVKPSRYRSGTLVAVSRLRSDFTKKSRIKVIARVVEDEDGYYTPEIRVINQIDDSEPSYFAHSSYATGAIGARSSYTWRNVTFNETLEAKLLNEIHRELAGRENPYSGQWHANRSRPRQFSRSRDNRPPAGKSKLDDTW